MPENEKLPLEQAWKIWTNCLQGSDENAIFQQIPTMIWDTAIFRLIVESRQIQIEKDPNMPAINGSFHSFIDRNYFQSQVTQIRRLTDKSYGLTGRKGVYSITALLNNIKKYRFELTREALFKLRNLPYDYADKPKANSDWDLVIETHQIFDRLSGVSPQYRQPDDIIAERVFNQLHKRLDICHEIINYVDKYIAHSSTQESRVSLNSDFSGISFQKIWEAQRAIVEVAEFLSVVLFDYGIMALPIENPNFYQYWQTPLFEETQIDQVRYAFEKYRKETENWVLKGSEKTWRFIEE